MRLGYESLHVPFLLLTIFILAFIIIRHQPIEQVQDGVYYYHYYGQDVMGRD